MISDTKKVYEDTEEYVAVTCNSKDAEMQLQIESAVKNALSAASDEISTLREDYKVLVELECSSTCYAQKLLLTKQRMTTHK